MSPAIRAIDNLVTIESPTGDKQSSPKVWKRYITTRNTRLTLKSSPASPDPTTREKKPMEMNKIAIANFIVALGSIFFYLDIPKNRQTQEQTKL